MPKIDAYECSHCGNLCREAFTVNVEHDKIKFNYKGTNGQPRIVLTLCSDCISKVGDIIHGSVQC